MPRMIGEAYGIPTTILQTLSRLDRIRRFMPARIGHDRICIPSHSRGFLAASLRTGYQQRAL